MQRNVVTKTSCLQFWLPSKCFINFIFRVMDAAALRHIYNASTDAQYYVNIHDLSYHTTF